MQKNTANVSVIIPNWNGKHLLKTCLTSLEKQTLKDFEIIVVDNGSSDGSVEFLKENFPKVKIIKLDKNYGFAKAVNMGIKLARGKYIVLLNNDTESDKNCLKFLVSAADKHSDAGFVAAKILNFYHRDIIDNAGDYIDGGGHPNTKGTGEKDGPQFNKEGYLFMATGGGSLFKRWVFDKVDLFDEEYITNMEDYDFCLRAQMLGIKGWFMPQAKIYHIRRATSCKEPDNFQYLTFRNMTINVIKNFPDGVLLHDWNFLKVILVNVNTFFYLSKKGYVKPALRAEWYILTNFLRLLKKRREIQSKKVVPDQYFIDNFVRKKITFWGLLKN